MGICKRVLGSRRNKEHESNKNALYLISVFVAYFGHFSAIPVVCRFAVFSFYIYLQGWKLR